MVLKKPERRGGAGRIQGRPSTGVPKYRRNPCTFAGYRFLLGLEISELMRDNISARDPITFMVIVSFVFIITRLLMDEFREGPVDWNLIEIVFETKIPFGDFYPTAARRASTSRNGSRKLKRPKTK